MARLSLMEVADRGELAPDVELRAFWDAFCDCDPTPDDFADRMEAAGFIYMRAVDDDDLDDAFAAERGVEPGGTVWDLTPAGRLALKDNTHE